VCAVRCIGVIGADTTSHLHCTITQMDRQTNRETDRQSTTNRQTDGRTDLHAVHCHCPLQADEAPFLPTPALPGTLCSVLSYNHPSIHLYHSYAPAAIWRELLWGSLIIIIIYCTSAWINRGRPSSVFAQDPSRYPSGLHFVFHFSFTPFSPLILNLLFLLIVCHFNCLWQLDRAVDTYSTSPFLSCYFSPLYLMVFVSVTHAGLTLFIATLDL
jgi:hypothetical protein